MAVKSSSLSETEGHVKGLWFGNPKSGKTTELAKAAHLGKIVAIDTEGQGWLKKPLRDQGIPVDNITRYTPTTFRDMQDIFWEIKSWFDECDQAGTPELAPVAVCIDHMTDLEARFLSAIRGDRVSKIVRPLEARAAAGVIEAKNALAELNRYKNERDDYGVWTNQARELMRMYRDLPCHVAFAAHFRTEAGVRVPALTEKFRIDLMGSMNVVIGTTTLEVGDQLAYVGYTRELNGWYGGDRFNVLKPITVNPSFDRVIAAAQGKLDFDTDEEQQAFKRAATGD